MKALGAIAVLAILAVIFAGVFVVHEATASGSVGTSNATGSGSWPHAGNSTAGHTCPNMGNTTGTTSSG